MWDDDNRGTYRPVQIEIHLMQDGQHIDTVILNSENNWHHIFKDLPADHVYTLNEVLGADVYYEPEYSIENGVYVITNRRTVTPTPTAHHLLRRREEASPDRAAVVAGADSGGCGHDSVRHWLDSAPEMEPRA